ncbi:MAG: glycerophosphodiester phosphodiesterase, partial [Dermabacter sp.]|nr:glycerophosphodiester phosphodiesterase [Dermabacter sp.]
MNGEMMSPVQLVAHRGDPVAHVENTLQAIAHAAAEGLEVVEVDLRLSAEGEPILLHDSTLERLWECTASPAELSVSALEAREPAEHGTCANDHGFERGVPTLERALDAVGDAVLLLDFPGESDGAEQEIARVSASRIRAIASGEGDHSDERRAAAARAEFTGGGTAMRAVREVLPTARLRMTYPLDGVPDPALVEELEPYSWNPHFGVCSPTTVSAARALGLRTTCWTVDDAETARALAAMGVEAVTSNRAGDLLRVLNQNAEVRGA